MELLELTPVALNKNLLHPIHGLAARGVSSCGWLYGFKLHLITNHLGEVVSFAITKGNISDQNMTTKLSKNLSGFLFGERIFIT